MASFYHSTVLCRVPFLFLYFRCYFFAAFVRGVAMLWSTAIERPAAALLRVFPPSTGCKQKKKMISHKKILILSSATHSLLFFSRSLLARHFTITTADKTEKWFSTQRQSLPKNTHKWHISYHDAHTKYMYIYIPHASRNITKLEILNYSIRGARVR